MTSGILPRTEKLENRHILYDAALIAKPSADIFDVDYLAASGALVGRTTGRGDAVFFRMGEQEWVLRHFLRGGLVGKIFHDHYLGVRLEGTRAWTEWSLLAELFEKGLPVPRPVAASVQRRWGFYSADLVTVRIPGARPLADCLGEAPVTEDLWRRIGACIARFHRHGVYHADLNAKNIMLDGQGQVYLLDFDRGCIRSPGRWAEGNLSRLKRSLEKFKSQQEAFCYGKADWEALLGGYRQR